MDRVDRVCGTTARCCTAAQAQTGVTEVWVPSAQASGFSPGLAAAAVVEMNRVNEVFGLVARGPAGVGCMNG